MIITFSLSPRSIFVLSLPSPAATTDLRSSPSVIFLTEVSLFIAKIFELALFVPSKVEISESSIINLAPVQTVFVLIDTVKGELPAPPLLVS